MIKRKRGRPIKAQRWEGEPVNIPEVGGTDETKAQQPSDADFLTKLPEQLGEVADSINRAYFRLVGRLLCRASKAEKTILGKLPEYSRSDVILLLRYQAWNRRAYREGFDMDALIGMICDNHVPSLYDRLRDREPGWHARHLASALRLYLDTEIPPYRDYRGVWLLLEGRLAQTGDHRA